MLFEKFWRRLLPSLVMLSTFNINMYVVGGDGEVVPLVDMGYKPDSTSLARRSRQSGFYFVGRRHEQKGK